MVTGELPEKPDAEQREERNKIATAPDQYNIAVDDWMEEEN